ncbi:hypothetical protein [Chryseobacterium binzhouense]|uniref:hypothetical protein n=1 Tax=Chryseobacterium binzhouense TaxID=2593646 RepID=UPI001181358B|nr:hypothetical protein [Chryseobacterium binzhouense]
MKKSLSIASLVLFSIAYSQSGRVGINTEVPKTTLDVSGKVDSFGASLSNDMTGLQAPRLTRAELIAKGESLYGTNQKGALIYVTDTSGADAPSTSQRKNVTSVGYYYFDGEFWIKLSAGNSSASGDTTQDIWKDVVAESSSTNGPQSAGGPARTETSILTTGTDRTNYQKAVYTDTHRFGLGTVNPNGTLHTYGITANYLDRIGNGPTLFLRKSAQGSSASAPTAVGSGIGLGQFVMSSYTGEAERSGSTFGGWNETAGASIQAFSTEAWSATTAGTALRITVTPNGADPSSTINTATGVRKPAFLINHNGKVIVSDVLPFGTSVPTSLTGRFSIQDTTSDAFYINAPLANFSTNTSKKILVWDGDGSTVTTLTNANGIADSTTLNKGKVGYLDATGLVNVTVPATLGSAGNVTEAVVDGSSYYPTASTGIILTSPNGSTFKITVNDDGSLNSTKVTTP